VNEPRYGIEWNERDTTKLPALTNANELPITATFAFVIKRTGEAEELIAAAFR
jgi:hypothetical protein